jgi:putative redox protein
MVKMSMEYEGDLRCHLKHGPSGSEILTDAPVDNQGRGAAFSPTDLVAAALGSCMLTVMGIAAKKNGIRLEGAKADVQKEMVADPLRRIGSINVLIQMPKGIVRDKREFLENIAHTCPVHKSLSSQVSVQIDFQYPD